MIDTEKMRAEADRMQSRGESPGLRAMLRAAADEIDAGRNARLVQYRCAAMGVVSWIAGEEGHVRGAKVAENIAHAMLAAERAPEVKP